MNGRSARGTLTRSPVVQLFEAQDLAAEAARGIMAFVRRSIESRYGAEPLVVKAKPQNEMDVEA